MNYALAIILGVVTAALFWYIHREQRKLWKELVASLEEYAKTLKSNKAEGDKAQ